MRPRPPRRPVAIHFSFDRPVDASMAPFFMAAKDGRFGAEHLNVSFNSAAGSPEALARVAKGDSELALVDINELIRFRDKADAPPIKAVFVLFNRAPYAIVARKSRGIQLLSDLDGKTVGVADSDLSIRLWPALARQNGIDVAHVEILQDERGGARAGAVGRTGRRRRRLLLSLGREFARPRRAGRRSRRAALCRLWLRGLWFCRVANPAFAAAKPDALKGFVRALIAGINATAKEPARAADEAAGRIDDGDRDLELARLRTVLADNILTDEVRRNGLGGVDPARLERSIDQIARGIQIPQASGGGRHLRRPVPAAGREAG